MRKLKIRYTILTRRDVVSLLTLIAVLLCTIRQFETFVEVHMLSDSNSLLSRAKKVPKGRVFVCGYEYAPNMMFPDYVYQPDSWDPEKVPRNTTEHDILVFGMHGPCASDDIPTIVQYQFAGKVLFMNGESRGNIFSELVPTEWIESPDRHPQLYRLFQIGPYPNASQTRTPFDSNATLRSNYNEVYSRQSRLVHHMEFYFSRLVREELQLSNYSQGETANPRNSMTLEWLYNSAKRPRSTGTYEAATYLASNCDPSRELMAELISQTVAVHYGGICGLRGKNTARMPSKLRTSRDSFSSNHLILHEYKYCLAMENAKVDGYLTEKIFNAFWGGCLPIYSGSDEVFEVFNPDSFVYFDMDNPEPALNILRRLEANASFYDEMMSASILKNGKESFDKYFSVLPFLGDGSVIRNIRQMMGISF